MALIGVGEIGGVFARALLRAGHPVVPVTREISIDGAADEFPEPALVLVTVGEADLAGVLDALPAQWRDRVGLVQNELLPRDWRAHDIERPTVASVWFEKKPGRDVKVVVSTPIWGPQASLLVDALTTIEIPAYEVADATAMRDELVVKTLYILTANLGGLAVGGGTVAEMWNDHHDLARSIADDVLAIQESLAGTRLDGERLIAAMVDAFMADPAHGSMGRSAPARLERAIANANAAGLAVPTLRSLAARTNR